MAHVQNIATSSILLELCRSSNAHSAMLFQGDRFQIKMGGGFHAIIDGRFEIIIGGQFHHNTQLRWRESSKSRYFRSEICQRVQLLLMIQEGRFAPI